MGTEPTPATQPKSGAGEAVDVQRIKMQAAAALLVPGTVESIAAKHGYDPAKYRAALDKIAQAPRLTKAEAEAWIADAHPETARIAAEQAAAAQAAQSAATDEQGKADRLAAEREARTKEKIALDRERLQLQKDRILIEAAIRAGRRSAE